MALINIKSSYLSGSRLLILPAIINTLFTALNSLFVLKTRNELDLIPKS